MTTEHLTPTPVSAHNPVYKHTHQASTSVDGSSSKTATVSDEDEDDVLLLEVRPADPRRVRPFYAVPSAKVTTSNQHQPIADVDNLDEADMSLSSTDGELQPPQPAEPNAAVITLSSDEDEAEQAPPVKATAKRSWPPKYAISRPAKRLNGSDLSDAVAWVEAQVAEPEEDEPFHVDPRTQANLPTTYRPPTPPKYNRTRTSVVVMPPSPHSVVSSHPPLPSAQSVTDAVRDYVESMPPTVPSPGASSSSLSVSPQPDDGKEDDCAEPDEDDGAFEEVESYADISALIHGIRRMQKRHQNESFGSVASQSQCAAAADDVAGHAQVVPVKQEPEERPLIRELPDGYVPDIIDLISDSDDSGDESPDERTSRRQECSRSTQRAQRKIPFRVAREKATGIIKLLGTAAAQQRVIKAIESVKVARHESKTPRSLPADAPRWLSRIWDKEEPKFRRYLLEDREKLGDPAKFVEFFEQTYRDTVMDRDLESQCPVCTKNFPLTIDVRKKTKKRNKVVVELELAPNPEYDYMIDQPCNRGHRATYRPDSAAAERLYTRDPLFARRSLPPGLRVARSHLAGKGVFATQRLPPYTIFGPYRGKRSSLEHAYDSWEYVRYQWQVAADALVPRHMHSRRTSLVIDSTDKRISNWLRYVNHEDGSAANLFPVVLVNNVYYVTSCTIEVDQELLVDCGSEFDGQLNKHSQEERRYARDFGNRTLAGELSDDDQTSNDDVDYDSDESEGDDDD